MGRKIEQLKEVTIDTNIVVYLLEENPRYIRKVEKIFSLIEGGRISAKISSITLTEVLIRPYALEMDELAEEYKVKLISFPNLEITPPDIEIAAEAARIRARYGVEIPDAICLATSPKLLTNDVKLKKVKEVEVLLLDEIV